MTKVIAGAVVGAVAGTTLLAAIAFLLYSRRRRRRHGRVGQRTRKNSTPHVAPRDSFLPRLSEGEEATLPVKRPPLRLATMSTPEVHHITPFMQHPSRVDPETPRSPEKHSPIDALSRAVRCSVTGRVSRASSSQSPSRMPSNSSLGRSPISPSRTLRKASSSASLGVSYPPTAYSNALRNKASASSLHSLGSPIGNKSLQPLVIPPARGAAASPTTASAVSPQGGSQTWMATRNTTSPVDLLRGEGLDNDSPRGVTRYAADTLIEGWNPDLPVRYEVEVDGGVWTENVVRLPPRYSSVPSRGSGPAIQAHEDTVQERPAL
ncbi:hypothetical protein EXIGLDRAFT_281713 [Exidia glandulosa HHB12029]|uniref:Uncharacterized protein n=1 Tax=Exidia glandulosa HHB12029 TaxID=1314781 RepID=A0A165DIV4_EXIGL|nr:hypothetical protein EXIGLDRAFT_281713 [Exidia glandulosa HHB12029]